MFAGTDPADMIGRTMSADGFSFTVEQTMVDHIRVYVDLLRGLRAMGYVIALENRVSPQWCWSQLKLEALDIELFGTADCIAYNPATRHLIIVDLKFGVGVAVEAEANPQLLYYSAGALNPDIIAELCKLAGTEPVTPLTVDIIVCQPRAPHPAGPVRRASYTAAEVMDWNQLVLHPGVKRALEDNGKTFDPGKHCRFCPAASVCETLRNFSLDTARMAFREAPAENVPVATTDPAQIPSMLPQFDLSDDVLGELLDRIAIVGPWIEGLKVLAADRLEAGRSVKGWKLVPKAARRAWSGDEDEIISNLKGEGFHVDQFMRRSLMSPAQVEKEVGKKLYAAHVQQFVGKNSSGTTLAPEGDPRSRLGNRSAREAFSLPNPAKE